MIFPCNVLTAVQLLGARAWKMPVLALLAINTAIAMKQTDGFLSTKLVDPTYAAFPGRMDTTIAGGSLNKRSALCGMACILWHTGPGELHLITPFEAIKGGGSADFKGYRCLSLGLWQSALTDVLPCNDENLYECRLGADLHFQCLPHSGAGRSRRGGAKEDATAAADTALSLLWLRFCCCLRRKTNAARRIKWRTLLIEASSGDGVSSNSVPAPLT